MYSLLIIEDEMLECETLAAMVERGYPEIRPIFRAANSDEALTIIQAQNPDILLVDICIPGVSGLTLMQTVVSEGYKGRFIITTAHDRFAYAKKALEMDCTGYLLKPVQDKELERMLRKCFVEIDMRRSGQALAARFESVRLYAQTFLAQDILEGNIQQNVLSTAYNWPSDQHLRTYLGCWSSPFTSHAQAASIAQQHLQRCLSKAFSTLVSIIDRRVVVLLQVDEQDERFTNTALWCLLTVAMRHIDEGLKISSIFRLSGLCTSYAQLQDAYRDITRLPPISRQKDTNCYFYVLPEMNLYAGMNRKQYKVMRQRIVQRLREKRIDLVFSALERLDDSAGHPFNAMQLLLDALLHFNDHFPLDEALMHFLGPDPLPSVRKWLTKILRVATPTQSSTSVIETALSIIRRRYHEPLTQVQIAEDLGLTPTYFSRLFKEKAGVNFVVALRDTRLNHAKELLISGQSDMDAIAMQCGYTSGKYLITSFKQKYGVTPVQFQTLYKNQAKDGL